jgi:hypothetical protein
MRQVRSPDIFSGGPGDPFLVNRPRIEVRLGHPVDPEWDRLLDDILDEQDRRDAIRRALLWIAAGLAAAAVLFLAVYAKLKGWTA